MNTVRLAQLWALLATDTELSLYVTPADLAEFKTRVEAEGVTFLTTVLPRLDKAMLSAFRTGKLDSIEGFKKAKGCVYPAFLRMAWAALFTEDGTLRWLSTAATLKYPRDIHDESVATPIRVEKEGLTPFFSNRGYSTSNIEPEGADMTTSMGLVTCSEQQGAATCIRQLSAIFYKLEMPFSDTMISSTLSAFKQTERDLEELDLSKPLRLKDAGCYRSTVLRRARNILRRLLSGVDPRDILPKHSSGATADKTEPWERYGSAPRYIPRLAAMYPYDEYFFASPSHLVDKYHEMEDWQVCEDPLARVTFVPKDSRGPRLISCEPTEFMYIQQGLMAKLYDTIDSLPAIKHMVGCTDQTVNQRMALLGSEIGSYATLDLKEASDRVSLDLVERLFPENWVEAFKSCRSSGTILPSHTTPDGTPVPKEKVMMNKFAPMGSALCFPVEALVFWSLSLAAMSKTDGFITRMFKNRLTTEERMCLTVFGDDIIVHRRHYDAVIDTLESVGLKVNLSKSYCTGPFRESCGHDYYHGSFCTPIRVKHTIENNDEPACFRAVDILQGIINRYGVSNPSLTCLCRSLYRDWFGITLPVTTCSMQFVRDVESVTGLMLGDPHWVRGWDANATTLRPLKKAERKSSVNVPLRDRITPVRYRIHGDYQVHQIRVLTEVASTFDVDQHNWCYVLKAFLAGSGAGMLHEAGSGPCTITGRYSLPKRCRYKYGWLDL